VDLRQSYSVKKVVIYNRIDCCRDRILNSIVTLRDVSNKVLASYKIGDASRTDVIDIEESNFEYPAIQWKINEGSIESTLCEGMVMQLTLTATPSESSIVLGTKNDLGWNQQWSIKSTSAVLLPQNDKSSQEWNAVFEDGNYDYALLPGFSESLSNDVRKVKIQLEGKNALHMREVQVLDCAGVNVAKGKTARQSSTWMSTTVTFSLNASSAVDGNLNTYSHTGFDQGKHQ
jgi:hypothetical protein